jgi:protein-S-isoprenylcysteine O-methyltransferase Ste14
MIRFPPPLVFVTAFVVALVVDLAAPLRLADGGARAPLGIVLIVGGVALSATALGLFARARTTIVPHQRASQLVTTGPYRFTRNPMYVALATIYVGAALMVGSLWPIALLPVPLAFLDRVVIPFEERTLRGAFKDDYDAYCRRVRRWLGRQVSE